MDDSSEVRERDRASSSVRSDRMAVEEKGGDKVRRREKEGGRERDDRYSESNKSHRSREREGTTERHRHRDERPHQKLHDYHNSSTRRMRSRSRSPDKYYRHRRHKYDSEASNSSVESDNESEDAQRARRKRERRRREEEKEDSDYEKRKRRRDRERRETSEERADRRRKKKERKQSKKAHKGGAIMDYGKHGVINETDVTSRFTSEFRQWLVEERHINPETISRAIEKKELASFIEDYNTATFPSDKYYNLEAHERRMAMIRAGETLEEDLGGYDPLADEAAAKASFKAKRRVEESNRGTPAQWQSKEQLEALHRVQMERIEAAKMKQLGLQISATKGVRMDGTEFDRR